MPNYRRLISYIYAYEGAVKGKNIGFAKIETRGVQCKITVSVKRIYVGGNDIGVYLLAADEEIFLGNIFIRGGSGEFRTVVSASDIEHSGINVDQCFGLTIHDVKNTWRSYTTIWEDAVAHAAEVDLGSTATAVSEKKQSVISEEQIKRAVREIEEEFPLRSDGIQETQGETSHKEKVMEASSNDQEEEAAPVTEEQEVPEEKALQAENLEAENQVPDDKDADFAEPAAVELVSAESEDVEQVVADEEKDGERELQYTEEPEAQQEETVEPEPEIPEIMEAQPEAFETMEEPSEASEVMEEQPGAFEIMEEQPGASEIMEEQPGASEVMEEKPETSEIMEEQREVSEAMEAQTEAFETMDDQPHVSESIEAQQQDDQAQAGEPMPENMPEALQFAEEPVSGDWQNAGQEDSLSEAQEKAEEQWHREAIDVQEREAVFSEPYPCSSQDMAGNTICYRADAVIKEDRSNPEIRPELGNPDELERLRQNEVQDEISHDIIWEKLKREHTRILAFDYEDGCEILTIKPQDIGLLPRDAWVYGNNSFLLHGYYNYRYLILAKLLNPNGTPRYLLGIPGHYFSNERYMASMFGFPNFVLSKEQPMEDGRFGFWYTDVKLGG